MTNPSNQAIHKHSQLGWFSRLTPRLTFSILIIAVPLLIAVSAFVTTRAGALIEEQANRELVDNTGQVENTLTTWINLHERAVTQLTLLPDITSMDPARQRPILQAMAAAYPNIYLVQTTGLDGINIARNDEEAPKDYHDRQWFIGSQSGAATTLEVVVGRTIGKPALNIAAPIKDASGKILGVADVATRLDDITATVGATTMGQTGYVFVVDSKNQVVAHPNPAFTSGDTLQDLSAYPPVAAMRQGTTGIMNFVDENGKHWRAHISVLQNGWGVITQQPEAELLAPLRVFQNVATLIVAAGASLLFILTWFFIRRALQPIGILTTTVDAITAGDFSRRASIASQNEIGILALAFNSMAGRLSDLIANLESRVRERTTALEESTADLQSLSDQMKKRADELQAVAQVGRAITSVQSIDKLLPQVTSVISEQFGFYHIGIFLLTDTKDYAILTASNSPGGQKMLERNHKLKTGTGVVGYVAKTDMARIALDTGSDATFFENPDLPQTHSEIALPLRVAGETIGVLDVQSEKTSAFTNEDVELLTIVADQVSIAIQNARRFEEAQKSIADIENLNRQYIQREWKSVIDAKTSSGYRYTGMTIESLAQPVEAALIQQSLQSGKTSITHHERQSEIAVPIKLRGQVIGIVNIRSNTPRVWAQDEIDIAQAIAENVALASDNARLLESSQSQAAKERTIGEITSKISAATNMDNILKIAVSELGNIIVDTDISIQFVPGQDLE